MADPYKKYPNYVPLEKMKTKDNKPHWLVVHCSDSEFDDFESIQRFHITSSDHLWENIGYHYVIQRDGKVKSGRPELYHGAHVEGMNKETIGICLCGKFETHEPNQLQKLALRNLLIDLSKKYTIAPSNIVPHRHFTDKKSCYGSFLSDSWARDLLSGNAPATVTPEVNPDPGYLKMKQALGPTLWAWYKKLFGIKE